MKKIRVLVVDDSFFMRKMVSDLLQSSGVIEVIDTAKNGIEAIEKTINLSPDIITLDVEMPKMNGLEALQKIMSQHPVPVIMLSSLTKQGADTTIQALQFGAFDFVAKPSGSISFDINKVKKELIDKILLAHSQRDKLLKPWKKTKEIEKIDHPVEDLIYSETGDNSVYGIVAIGTSTGGPRALQEVITKLPQNMPYPVLIVQHMPAGFTKSLAVRLNSLSKISVVEATDNEELEAGKVYIAPGDYHMEVKQRQSKFFISLNQEKAIAGHRPSVDTLYQSLGSLSLKKVFVIMTGMGSDGTKGLLAAKKKGDILIAQDEQTCVVYGMPKSAVNSGLVDIVSPLYQIPSNIVNSIQNQRRWQSWN